MESCKLCNEPNVSHHLGNRDAYEVSCPRCGTYLIAGTATKCDLKMPAYLLSAAVRQASDNGHPLEISTSNQSELVKFVRRPKDPLEAIDLIVREVYTGFKQHNQRIQIDASLQYPVFAAHDPEELAYWLSKVTELGFLQALGYTGYVTVYEPTLRGWERASELQKNTPRGNQAFVAMSFANVMDNVWLEGLKPAIASAGYEPMMLKGLQHNDNINDKIMSEIRRSALVVVDFTQQRGGCYFEAGFALGLGIPVVWCCNEVEKERLHFDTRQYNHIFYSTPSDLREQLYTRIAATAPLN